MLVERGMPATFGQAVQMVNSTVMELEQKTGLSFWLGLQVLTYCAHASVNQENKVVIKGSAYELFVSWFGGKGAASPPVEYTRLS